MKKLLLLLLLSLSFIGSANTDEPVNLTCTYYENYNWIDATYQEATITQIDSLVIYPESKIALWEGKNHTYIEEGNSIKWIHNTCDEQNPSYFCSKTEYSLDKTTGILKFLWNKILDDEKLSKTGKVVLSKYITFSYRCKKTENLF